MTASGPYADADDPRMTAAISLIARTGARAFQLRYSDDPEPVVWIADVEYKQGREAAGGMTPLTAVLRLLDELVDGGTCAHCRRPTGVSDDWTRTFPLAERICWYQYDPELQQFRRGCEGDEDRYQPVGRNDPCPCGSGQKFKHCHGSRT